MAKPHLPNPRFYKTIFAANYKPHLRFYELLIPAALKFNEYPHWKTDRLKITLRDYEKRCNLTIAYNTFTFAQDLNENEYQMQYIEKLLTLLPKDIEVSSYNRLGFRRKYLTPIDMNYSELVRLNFIKNFSYDDLGKILPESIDDLSFTLDCSDEKMKFHINFGPIIKNQIQTFIEFDRENHLDPMKMGRDYVEIIESYPEKAIFLDIDIYKEGENIALSDAIPFLKEADSRMVKLANDFRDFLFAQKGV